MIFKSETKTEKGERATKYFIHLRFILILLNIILLNKRPLNKHVF